MSSGTRIPLAEAVASCAIIECLIKDYSEKWKVTILKYMIVGSIRRKRETCGDGDIVFWEKDRHVLTYILQQAKTLGIIQDISLMYNGLVNSVTMLNGFKIEFYFAHPDGWWHKIQFITGSRDYNEVLIAKMKAIGKTLKREGFYDESGHRIIANSEEELFTMYGEEFVSPEKRSLILPV